MTSIAKRVIAVTMTAMLLLPLSVAAEAIMTLTTVENGKDLIINVQGLESSSLYSVLLADAAGNELPFESVYSIPEIPVGDDGALSDSITVAPTYPDGIVTIQIIKVGTEEMVASTTVELQGDIWVIAEQAAPDATAPITGMPDTGGGGTVDDAQSSLSLSTLVVVAGMMLLAGFTLVAMQLRTRGQQA